MSDETEQQDNGTDNVVALHKESPKNALNLAGPAYVVTIPETYTRAEMNEVCDAVLALPTSVVGAVVVVREGVAVCPLPLPE